MTTTTAPAQRVLPQTDAATPGMQMLEMLYGALATQMISVAAELAIADQVADGPRHVSDLTAVTGTDERSLYRLLRALAGLGIFEERSDGVFAATPLSDTLRSGVVGSMKELAEDVGSRSRLLAYSALGHSVRTGRPAFDHVHGTSMWSYLQGHPTEVARFGKAMGNLASRAHATVFERYDLSGVDHLVDVGGGEGYLVATLLGRYPEMRATVFDESHVAQGAGEVLSRAGVLDRVHIVGGDLFDAVPSGGDAYVLSSILFSYEDDEVRRVLRNVRRAMDPDGRVLILEPVLTEGNDHHPGKLLDITQLALHRGGVRSERQFRSLMEASGLRLAEVHRLWPAGPTDLVVGVPQEQAPRANAPARQDNGKGEQNTTEDGRGER